MAFDTNKFKFLKKKAQVKEMYGENADNMLRGVEYKKPEKKKVEHSFPHLLNKRFVVKQLNLPSFDDYSKPRNTYPITEKDRVKQLLRNGAKEKTFLDD